MISVHVLEQIQYYPCFTVIIIHFHLNELFLSEDNRGGVTSGTVLWVECWQGNHGYHVVRKDCSGCLFCAT